MHIAKIMGQNEKFLISKDKNMVIWRSVTKFPYVLVRKLAKYVVAKLLGHNEIQVVPPITLDVEKMNADDVALLEIVSGVPTSLFEHIKL